PSSGPVEGGTDIVITGSNFLSDSTVTVGGTLADNIVIVDSATINAVTPTGTEGNADLVVTTSAGSATLAGGFSYTTGTGNILFSDNFSDGDALGWTISPLGNEAGWSVVSGIYSFDGSGHTQSYTGDAAWQNYNLQVDFQLDSLSNYPGGIRGRIDPATGAGYALWLYPADGRIILWRTTQWHVDSPGLEQLANASGINFGVGTQHTIAMNFTNNVIEVYFDGELQFTVVDDTLSSGLIALDVSNQPISFDNVVVTLSQ
uniref:IPT/TIG domain-containing protein n=1 Tax=Desulfosediminicola sp. TaxID=2886825 RepID=UPI003AF2D2A8